MSRPKVQPETASIYVLVDPRDGEIRYVGWTTKTLAWRLGRHINARGKTWRDNWIASLKKANAHPLIRLVQHVPFEVSQGAEQYWVKFFRDTGCRLTNLTKGGDGLVGYVWTPEARVAAIGRGKGKIISAEQRAKASIATIRQMQDPAQRAAVARVHQGKTISEVHRKAVRDAAKRRWIQWRAAGGITSLETRAKISSAKRGKPGPPVSIAAREKIAASKRGKPRSAETRAKISASRLAHATKVAV